MLFIFYKHCVFTYGSHCIGNIIGSWFEFLHLHPLELQCPPLIIFPDLLAEFRSDYSQHLHIHIQKTSKVYTPPNPIAAGRQLQIDPSPRKGFFWLFPITLKSFSILTNQVIDIGRSSYRSRYSPPPIRTSSLSWKLFVPVSLRTIFACSVLCLRTMYISFIYLNHKIILQHCCKGVRILPPPNL